MTCPQCGAPFSQLIPGSRKLQSDSVNQFGRREIVWTVQHEELINWDPEKKLYHCKRCGASFTEKEHTLGRIE